jgi:hypothetical protein
MGKQGTKTPMFPEYSIVTNDIKRQIIIAKKHFYYPPTFPLPRISLPLVLPF